MHKTLLTIMLGFSLTLGSQFSQAGGPSTNFSRAIDHSVHGAAYASGASTQAVATAVALPFVLIGETARVSVDTGAALLEFASMPLEITEESPSARQAPGHPSGTDSNSLLPPDRALFKQ